MANYCENTIKINQPQDPKLFKRLLNRLNKTPKKDNTDLLNIAISDNQIKKLWDDKGIIGLSKKLGTKWLTLNDLYTNKDDYIELYTDSAWAPPIGWATIISKKFQCQISIKYDEPGMCFMGLFIVNNGKIIQDHCHDY